MNPKEGLAFRSSFWQSYLCALSYTILIGISLHIITENGHIYLLAIGGGAFGWHCMGHSFYGTSCLFL